MFYLVNIRKLGDNRYVAECPAIPELVTPFSTETEDGAMKLITSLFGKTVQERYRKNQKPIPVPAEDVGDKFAIHVPVKVEAKIRLWNYMMKNNIRISELAKALGVSQTQAQRCVDIDKDRASIDTVEEALYALGGYFTLGVEKFDD